MADTTPGERGYEVVKQTETVGKLADDTFGPVVKVIFRIASGAVLSIQVPTTDYSLDAVRVAIEERVRHANEIANL